MKFNHSRRRTLTLAIVSFLGAGIAKASASVAPKSLSSTARKTLEFLPNVENETFLETYWIDGFGKGLLTKSEYRGKLLKIGFTEAKLDSRGAWYEYEMNDEYRLYRVRHTYELDQFPSTPWGPWYDYEPGMTPGV